jgi:hypothetical protein
MTTRDGQGLWLALVPCGLELGKVELSFAFLFAAIAFRFNDQVVVPLHGILERHRDRRINGNYNLRNGKG